MLLSNPRSELRAPRLRVIANGQVIAGAMEAEVVSNNYYAADRFSASVALGIDQWAEASFWASEPDILLDVQFSLDGGASFTSLVQGAVDRVSLDPTLGLVHLDGRDLTASLIEARTQETFANRTSSEIASILAGRHDLTPRVSRQPRLRWAGTIKASMIAPRSTSSAAPPPNGTSWSSWRGTKGLMCLSRARPCISSPRHRGPISRSRCGRRT